MPPATRRAITALITLLFFLSAAPNSPPAAAQSGAGSLASTPGTITANVALGATLDTTITLRNTGTAPVALRVFEANAPAPQALALPKGAATVALPQAAARVDPQLRAELADGGETEFIAFLADQADLSAAYAIADWRARGEYVYRTLRDHAEATQGELRAALDASGASYTPLWIVNALAVRGDAADLAALASRAEVAQLRASRTAALELAPAQSTGGSCNPAADNSCWNIARVGANRVWTEFGVRGEGITVANIDSGVRFEHPALIGQYRGNTSGSLDHNYNWYDFFGNSPTPVDAGDHGTHTMGTMVAASQPPTAPAVGVAPAARWVAVRACSRDSCSEADLILAAQWVLAPTDLAGLNPRPDLRPHVVNNSWTSGQNATWYAGYTAAWRAAGIYPVFAAGNTLSNLTGCGSVSSPGDYADVTAVGSFDSADRLSSFSRIGPGPGGRLKPDLTAPGSSIWSTVANSNGYGTLSGTSMATPHVAGAVALLWSANPGLIGNYDATYQALAVSATPALGDNRYLGTTHAACQPTSSPNNIYGYGRLNTYAAVASVTVDVPWLSLGATNLPQLAAGAAASLSITLDARRIPGPGTYQARVLVHGPDLGATPLVVPITMSVPADAQHATLSGRVTRADDGGPLQATVTVAGGATVQTDSEGRYRVVVPPSATPYAVTADAPDYVQRSAPAQLGPGGAAALDFALEADVARLAADPAPRDVTLAFRESATLPVALSNQGTKTLTYTVSVPPERFGVWRSDEADGPASAWTPPPPSAVSLALTDDGVSAAIPLGFAFPYVGGIYDRVHILANGVISFTPIMASANTFQAGCIPLSETAGPAIVPLRVDLDPSKPGARVSYASTDQGFLVTWEQVPLYNDAATLLTFQALLQPDGRISLRYRNVPALTAEESASYGLQYDTAATQPLGCRSHLALGDGLTVELRPQQPAVSWLRITPQSGRLAADGVANLAALVSWVRPTQPWPQSGAILVESNDPAQPRLRLTVRLQTTDAPHTMLLPQLWNSDR
jgi:hypothetical protein